ncbi:hypothetical protein [Neptunitalea lumnitzerae]|uniref:Uncharacterized protein n=1 Tax=Neptunitalea lumnitzerae TaxID=2965509 RepID=A0ABQ5MEJ4_9FLAO|nr:hypothetical protein [Neptunitalea sp. Y10]GLB47766.1 hypothetical protein Y10_01340 [Neptunitalea sp. Y10]
MQVEVFFNEQKLDVDDATKISETKQINDFFEISDRQTSYTNTFKLPKTARNTTIFSGHSIPGITSLTPYQLHKVSVCRNGIPTIQNGLGYLKETTDAYSLYVYSDVVDLFDTVADKKLADLNLSMYNHTLTQSTFLDSFQRTSGYIYPMADYGKLDNGIVEWNYTVPAVFIKSLWDKIFQEAGFQYEYKGRVPENNNPFNPFITEEWQQLAITLDEGFSNDLDGDAQHILNLYRVDSVEDFGVYMPTFFGYLALVQYPEGEVSKYLQFTTGTDVQGLHQYTNSEQYNRSRIRIQQDGFYKIEIDGMLYNTHTDGMAMYVEQNGINICTVIADVTDATATIGFSERLYLQQGDELFIKIVAVAKEKELYYGYNVNLNFFTDNTDIAVNFGSYFQSISQKDFLKDIMWHFGLLCRRSGQTYEFIAIEELLSPNAYYSGYTLTANAIYKDWSDKLHSINSLDTRIGGYAQKNIFSYQYANSNVSFADATLPVHDATLDTEKVLIKRIYNASESSSKVMNGVRLRKCTVYEKELEDDGTLKSVKKIKSKPYLVRIKKKQGTLLYKQAGAENYYSITTQIPYATFDELDWNFILPEKYAAFANMLSYGKKYVVELLLNSADIHMLDFFKLVYLKQLGSLFYINKISNYSGDGFTKVELIQVRSRERLRQFSDDFGDDFSI